MNKCVCNTCKNLKSVIDEATSDEGSVSEECVFGFPSESCSECNPESCELTCENYEEDLEESKEEAVEIVACAICGKELKVSTSQGEPGEVFCPMCFLERK